MSSRESLLAALRTPLDRASEVPVGAQLGWRLRALIASGRVDAGSRLPSARELARMAGVNVNTVFAVYGRLEADGLIETEHGRGSFVRDLPRGASGVATLADQAAASARAAGIDPRDVAMTLFSSQPWSGEPRDVGAPAPERSVSTAAANPPPDTELEERQRLREQIAALEMQLSQLAPSAPADFTPKPGRSPSQPGVMDANALRAMRDQLQQRVDVLAAAAHERRTEAREARARRYSATTTTLEQSQSAAANTRKGERAPRSIVVRWTPAWRAG